MSFMSRLSLVFLGISLLGLAPAYGQEKNPPGKPWTGELADGRLINKKDLDEILHKHTLWVKSFEKEGKRADLREASLWKADLSGASLCRADLREADLSGASLRGADLSGTSLERAILSGANLSEAKLGGANLRTADLYEANLSGAILYEADLSGTLLERADLSGANLSNANLSGAKLIVAKLTGAQLIGADLSGAYLVMTDMSGAYLSWADLSGARFEPKPGSLPVVTSLLFLKGLDSLTFFETSSNGLMELREIYNKTGMREEERQVTFALNHNRRVKLWEKPGFFDKLDSLFNLVCFELTCDYGMTPRRPLYIMLGVLFSFTLPYLWALGSRNPRAGIWLVLLPDRILGRKLRDRPARLNYRLPFRPLPEEKWARFTARPGRGLRALRLAFYFSLLSAFHLGWREFNVGTWINRIQKREYCLRATGWPRTLSGIQSVLSVYMLTLWALSYFGRPFE